MQTSRLSTPPTPVTFPAHMLCLAPLAWTIGAAATLIASINVEGTAFLGYLILTTTGVHLSLCYLGLGFGLLCLLCNLFTLSTSSRLDLLLFTSLFAVFTSILPLVNTVLGVVFLLEFLTTVIFVLVPLWFDATLGMKAGVSPTFGHRQHSMSTPLDALFYFFWTSFLLAILFFYSLSQLLSRLATTDWLFWETLLAPLTSSPNVASPLYLTLLTPLFGLTLAFLLKFAFAPFFFWKPSLFRFLPPHALLLYIFVFFSLTFTWFFLIFASLPPLFIAALVKFSLLSLLIGLPLLMPLLLGFDRLQTFFAVSSVFNVSLLWLLFSTLSV